MWILLGARSQMLQEFIDMMRCEPDASSLWFCLACKTCEGSMVCCDGKGWDGVSCPATFHVDCYEKLYHEAVPIDDSLWLCASCQAATAQVHPAPTHFHLCSEGTSSMSWCTLYCMLKDLSQGIYLRQFATLAVLRHLSPRILCK